MSDALKSYTHDLKIIDHKRDKREPEFNFYDQHQTTLNVYKVKPAVFDLVLSFAIAGYLFLVYGLILKSSVIFAYMSNFMNGYITSTIAQRNTTKLGHTSANGNGDLGFGLGLNGHRMNGSNGTAKIKAN